ncbi:uncharacterized protein LOC133494466 isoform X1 [Syngnathoides biaculeatus]|uniref:uncharacterized protein LOC133494466 isoform X1 n=1 Tax=Syngnathoides biaculeatus TaxID=300417 RepID=UPI002ADDCBFA|nr:uncharacterized protein LOC133494466 isoform X1 [Syngnathoides biaculeatus]
MFKLCALFLALFRAHADVLFASPGDNVSLPCFFAAGAKYVCWYKQVAGDVPQIVTSFYGYVQTSRGHRLAADVGRRMAVHPGENFLHLNISHVRLSDSAEYYCGQSVLNVMRFDRGIFLLVRESGRPTVLQRPTSIAVSTGGSADLKCTAHPGVSHVYWFWKASGDSHLLHVHTENNSGCAETTESVCVFTLSRRAVADAGTYYCAVASCGEIVFGKGTRLDVGGGRFSDKKGKGARLRGVHVLSARVVAGVRRPQHLPDASPLEKRPQEPPPSLGRAKVAGPRPPGRRRGRRGRRRRRRFAVRGAGLQKERIQQAETSEPGGRRLRWTAAPTCGLSC